MEFGFWSLVPPMVAIFLALLTRRVLLPLCVGIACGAWLLASSDAQHSVIAAAPKFFIESIWQSVADVDHLKVLAFSLLLGAMVGVMQSSGSMQRLITRIGSGKRTRRRSQTMIALSGLFVFFDDYANTLLVGGTMRTTAEQARLSRAKLAYLVDSTAAPVAGLSLVSTWVATELSYLDEGLGSLPDLPATATFTLFIESLPYRFYPWIALCLVFVIARSGRDFGPMLAEEIHAQKRSESIGIDDELTQQNRKTDRGLLADALVSIGSVLICLLVVLATLIRTGYANLIADGGNLERGWLQNAGAILGSGNSYDALVYGGLAGWLFSMIAVGLGQRSGARSIGQGALSGAMQMMPAMLVLWLAWSLSSMTSSEQLNTGGFLSSILSERLDPCWLPTCVFLLASVLAFSTGTSWGTMAILTPIAVQLAVGLVPGDVDPMSRASHPITLATFSSVLAGAIFGDHCSPISDTTVLSSRASDCDHLVHVRTQMPYAIFAGVLTILCGTLPVGFGWSPYLGLAVAFIVTLVLVIRWGKDPAQEFDSSMS